jgi:hypothetical protein
MSKQIHFVVYYDIDEKKYYLDDETLMVKFDERAWFDDELEEWVRPEGIEESALDYAINNELATILQPDGAMYFAEDGSFGTAKGIQILDTGKWSEEDWERIDNASDGERAQVARTIANEKREDN